MKGLLIFAGLVVAAALYVMSHMGVVVSPILDHIAAQEGSVDSVQDAAQQDGFVAKYQSFLDQRYWIARVANILDDETFLKISGDACALYANTPLQNNPEYGFLIFHRGELLMDRNRYTDAGALFEQYSTLFPQGEDAATVRSAISTLRINHGVQ